MTLVAILGCSGSVGRRVVLRALQKGYKVLGIDILSNFPLLAEERLQPTSSPDFVYASLDLRNYEQLLEAVRGCDAVIQLAAYRDPGDYIVQTHNRYALALCNK
jgi:nucleoside-diphosphate-sugar epimerase